MQHLTLTFAWERLGTPPPGAVVDLAASPDVARDGTLFAATLAGLYRSRNAAKSWQRVGAGLDGAALSAIAVSPAFADDGLLLVASLDGGIFRASRDGDLWSRGDAGGRWVQGLAVALSPDFPRDGVAFAATLSDGIFRSDDRGGRWETCNFGLLDLNVLALAISPDFGADETIYAAASTGVFRSRNGGRAWREVEFPGDSVAAQCLALSPSFTRDGTLFAGTEADGLYRSTDRGTTWEATGGIAGEACINAIALSPHFEADRTLFVITPSALHVSRDAGDSWSSRAELPGALCLTVTPTSPGGASVLVGLTQGVYRCADDLTRWQSASEGIVGRLFTGLALSAPSVDDRRLLAYGPHEGVYKSDDGGATWLEDSDGLEPPDVTSLAVAVGPRGLRIRYAASPHGIWIYRDGGTVWEQASSLPARLIALSPSFADDTTMVAATHDQGLWVSGDAARRWQPVVAPWGMREILALSLSPDFGRDRRAFAVVRVADGAQVDVWQGRPGGSWEVVVREQDAAQGVGLAVPCALPWDGSWYAAAGGRLYALRTGADAGSAGDAGRPQANGGRPLPVGYGTVVALAALPAPRSSVALAAATSGLYLLRDDTQEWQRLDDGSVARPIVALAPSPTYAQDRSVYALEWGGTPWRLRLSDGGVTCDDAGGHAAPNGE